MYMYEQSKDSSSKTNHNCKHAKRAYCYFYAMQENIFNNLNMITISNSIIYIV